MRTERTAVVVRVGAARVDAQRVGVAFDGARIQPDLGVRERAVVVRLEVRAVDPNRTSLHSARAGGGRVGAAAPKLLC
jgi:hypothetical protein